MLILGIESSCDETALALVKDGREVLSSLILSQVKTHERWGGVIPEIAAREHLLAMGPLFKSLLTEAQLGVHDINAVAVTQGPGLVGCLLTGVSFAKGLSQSLQVPLFAVNHVHAHVHGALLGVSAEFSQIFPCLSLVVSGGHTNLYYMKDAVSFELLAHTKDDACGESFDKVGKMLGLPYPGGPHVEQLALSGKPRQVDMPTMLPKKSDLAFSYSGLKTAVAQAIHKGKSLEDTKNHIAYSFQEEALGQLVRKINSALALKQDVKSVLIAGGVAANQRFRSILNEAIKVRVYAPEPKYCSDNGAMIAALAFYEWKASKVITGLDWDVFSRYPFEQYKLA